MNVVTKYLIRYVAAENGSSTHPLDGWPCNSFSAMQKSTHYVASDCCRVFVQIAWPHHIKNPLNYNKQMEAVHSDFLTSVDPSKKQLN